MTQHIEVRTHCTAPRHVMFDLARSQRAHTESMAYSRESVRGPGRDLLEQGDRVRFNGRHFGLRFTLTGLVTELTAYERFTDQQVSGPFRSLTHQHLFVDEADGGCQMIDRLTFAAPFDPLGIVAEKAVLRRYMTWLLEQRGRELCRLADRG